MATTATACAGDSCAAPLTDRRVRRETDDGDAAPETAPVVERFVGDLRERLRARGDEGRIIRGVSPPGARRVPSPAGSDPSEDRADAGAGAKVDEDEPMAEGPGDDGAGKGKGDSGGSDAEAGEPRVRGRGPVRYGAPARGSVFDRLGMKAKEE